MSAGHLPARAVEDDTSRYGPTFWIGLAIGWAAISFGIRSLLSHAGSTHPGAVTVWLIGLLLLHDLVAAPATLVVAWVVRRGAPPIARCLVQGALAVSAVIALYAAPMVLGWGGLADNPSLLPRNERAGLLGILGGVWAVAALLVLLRLRRSRGSPGP